MFITTQFKTSLKASRLWRTQLPTSRLLQSRITNRRFISDDIQKADKEAGESNQVEETGIIEKTSQETVIYFDRVLPFRTNNPFLSWFSYFLIPDKSIEAIKTHVMNLANPKESDGFRSIGHLEISEVIPISRDGGAFVKFKVPAYSNISELNSKIHKNTLRESKHGLINKFSTPLAFPVKGSPWIEDLRRFPDKTILVKFQGSSLSEEELYALFRRYGTIIDIKPDQAVAQVIFRGIRGAICAKNCVTGLKLNNTVLHVQYAQSSKRNFIMDAIVNHQRISIPLILALLAAFAVAIFDPIREFFIETKITNKFGLDKKNKIVKYFLDLTNSTISSLHRLIGADEQKDGKRVLWTERMDMVKELKLWIEENANTFLIVRGARGAGKHELVMQHALHDRQDVLYIDCDKLVKSRTDIQFISNASRQIGYFPVFPWLNTVSNMLDLAVQGLTGQKSGFSETKDTQFRNMLSTALMSIRRISLSGYKPVVGSGENEVNIKEEDYLQQHPEKKPVIVIDRFTTVNKNEGNSFTYKELSDWAAMLISMNIAHVIFLTEDVGAYQMLSESLPDQVFKTITLSDASRESAKSYVLNSLFDNDPTEDEEGVNETQLKSKINYKDISKTLNQSLEPLGGRMLDLQAFVRRIKSGETPQEALNSMVYQTAEQITQIFLNKDQGLVNAQAWELIKRLSKSDTIEYDSLIYHPIFKATPEQSLTELERHGLITVTRDRGILKDIYPAKPIFKAAFANIVGDENLYKILETSYLLRLIKFENERISKFEQEIEKLSYVAGQREFRNRVLYLADKIETCNSSIVNAEAQIKAFSK
ncbi:hypothetical protein WICPIJ_007310 [Wickerhamomyces pijperi]|uniref:Mitochondrial escape protein 2 n=1 Tax=Wickerhamomyces pijperi TaxID=599730 RepID=A0A9P8TJD2_WICPI|nr:hypothetical protein WICPIJ_007310 [Wickerhamomyces pijperi]